jgi:hypothetical protein
VYGSEPGLAPGQSVPGTLPTFITLPDGSRQGVDLPVIVSAGQGDIVVKLANDAIVAGGVTFAYRPGDQELTIELPQYHTVHFDLKVWRPKKGHKSPPKKGHKSHTGIGHGGFGLLAGFGLPGGYGGNLGGNLGGGFGRPV